MGRNFNYTRDHLLKVLDVCEAWPTFEEAEAYISKSGAVEAYQPGLITLSNFGISDLESLRLAVETKHKLYD